MKVRMLMNKPASEDGVHVKLFEAGKSYDVAAELGEKWLHAGIAQEDKMVEAAPEMKDAAPVAPAPAREADKPKVHKRGKK